jgi:hypothetical protein
MRSPSVAVRADLGSFAPCTEQAPFSANLFAAINNNRPVLRSNLTALTSDGDRFYRDQIKIL